MEVTKHQLQQQVDFAKGILDILARHEADMPEERANDAKSTEAYCESVIKCCELAAELLDIEAAAKKPQAEADTAPAPKTEEPAEKPKRPRKKKKEEPASDPVTAEPEPAGQPAPAADDLDDLF